MNTRFDFTGQPRSSARFFACIRTVSGVTVLGEVDNPIAGLRLGTRVAKQEITAGAGRDIISVEVINGDGEIVLGELAEAFAGTSPDFAQTAA